MGTKRSRKATLGGRWIAAAVRISCCRAAMRPTASATSAQPAAPFSRARPAAVKR